LLLAIAAVPLLAEETRSGKSKSKPEAKAVELTPKTGIQKPGTLIPFSRLKAEAEIPGSPSWVLASDSLLIPAPSGEALEKIDLKTNKPSEPITGFSKPCAGAVSAFKSVWVANCGNGTIVRMEPKSNKVEATLNTGVASLRYGLAATAD